MNFLMLCRAWPIYCCLLEKRRWCSFLKHILSFKSLITKSIFPPLFFFSIKFEKINLHEYDIIASSQASLNSLSQRGKEIYQKRGKKLLDMHEYTNYLVGTHFSRKWEKERSMGLCHWNFNHIILVWSFFRILYRDKCMRGNDAKIQDANPFLLRNISPLWVKVVLRSFACEI